MNKMRIMIVAILVSCPGFAGEIKLSEVKIPSETIGKSWDGPTGLVIDNIDSPPTEEPQEVKEIVADLKKQMSPLGVKACADFTYRKKSNPFHQVTIRVFLFKSPAQCQQWTKTKYQFDEWEKKYKKIESTDSMIYDSLEMKKRIVIFDRVWITAGTIADTEDHLKILKLYVAALRKAITKSEK